jgi:hypothetical protein
MVNWTPKLDKLIGKYADYEEKEAKDGVNPRQTLVGSMVRISFREAVTGQPTYRKICAELGVESGLGKPDYKDHYKRNIQQMIDLARANGANAPADKLERARKVWVAVAQYGGGGANRIRMAKKNKLQY